MFSYFSHAYASPHVALVVGSVVDGILRVPHNLTSPHWHTAFVLFDRMVWQLVGWCDRGGSGGGWRWQAREDYNGDVYFSVLKYFLV